MGEHGTPEALRGRIDVHLDRQEEQSFPASDPPADWAGPPTWLSDGQRAPETTATARRLRGSAGDRRAERGRGAVPSRGVDVAGIPVRADATLLVIAALLMWSFWLRYSTVASRWGGLLMALVATVLFLGSVLAHELAHALEARRRGLHVRDITLYIFGGATRMTDEAARPVDEFALTVVGPWTSIVLGCAFGLVATGAGHLGLSEVAEVAGELGWLNVVLGIFNLLPGAPLDGGRILDSIVWRVTRDRSRAGRVSAVSGQVIGTALAALGVAEMLFFLGGFVGGLWLVLIGWFLVRAAAAERRLAAVRDRLRGRRVGDVAPPVAEVPTGTSLAWAVEVLGRAGGAEVVGVTGPGGIVGALTIDDLRGVPAEARRDGTVEAAMTAAADLPAVQAAAPATQLLPLLGDRPVAVLEGARVRSLVTGRRLETVLEWLPPLPRTAEDLAAVSGRGTGSRAPSAVRTVVLAASGALVLAAAVLVPMPLVEVSPGPTFDVPALLRTEGPVHPVSGELLLTSVRLDAPSIVATVGALFDPHREVLGRSSVVPSGIDPADFEASQRQVFLDSVQLASAVALQAAGYPVTISGGGAVVRAVATGGPATGVLAPGDVVVAVTGQKVDSASDLVAHLATAHPGTPVELRVRRGDRALSVEVSPAWSNELDRPTVGIAVEDAAPLVQLPFGVQVDQSDVGGPSAGLMTALAVYAVTTGKDLTGGRTVAGTGTIDAEGTVGPVGGIAEKVAAARAAGASTILVPSAQAADARRAADGLAIEVVPVASFSGALDRLESLRSTP